MNQETVTTVAAGLVGASLLLGSLALQPDTRSEKQVARDELVEWYYSLPKVVPGTGGKLPEPGYEGPVVRWDGTKDIVPGVLRSEYIKRAPSGAKATDTEADGLERL